MRSSSCQVCRGPLCGCYRGVVQRVRPKMMTVMTIITDCRHCNLSAKFLKFSNEIHNIKPFAVVFADHDRMCRRLGL
jgi:hypothetical protein